MSQASRRSFLALAGSGAVTTAVVVAAPASLAASKPSTVSSASTEPLLAHVRDAAAGTVVFYVGHDEVIVHDRDLVQRLTRAARR